MDVLADELLAGGVVVDGVVIVPAYIEAGRLTVDSVHWMRSAEGMIPVGESEFARDATFGYHHSAGQGRAVGDPGAGRRPAPAGAGQRRPGSAGRGACP